MVGFTVSYIVDIPEEGGLSSSSDLEGFDTLRDV